MNIILKTKHLELTEQLNAFVGKKMDALKKILKGFSAESPAPFDLFVEIGKDTMHHRKGSVFTASLKLALLDRKLVARATGEDLYEAIVEARRQLEQEIKKHKLKLNELPRRRYRKTKKEDA